MSADSRWLLALRVCGVQVILSLAAAVVWWLLEGSALAALAGGGAATFLSLWFALRVFGTDAAADPEGFLRRFYRAEFMKLGLAVLFFIVAANLAGDHMAEIITGFMAALMGFWFGLLPVAGVMGRSGKTGDK